MKRLLKGISDLFLGIMLFILSTILLIVLIPWGLVEMLIYYIWKRKFYKGVSAIGNIFMTVATLIDILGNVLLHIPMNRILNTSQGYRFGSRFDTISYVLGHGIVHNTLSDRGFKLALFLNYFEEDHCVRTYYKRHSNTVTENG